MKKIEVMFKTNLPFTGFNHVVDAIVGEEGGDYGVDKGQCDGGAGPG